MSKIFVRVVPHATENSVEKVAEAEYRVRLTSVPIDGKANKQLVRLLGKHFGIAPSLVRIVRGAAGRKKLVDLPEGL